MAVTLKEIAEATGLSIPTVSEILNDKRRDYRQETRRRVQEAADRLGYRPNISARSIKTGRFGSLALIQSTLSRRSYLPDVLLQGVSDALGDRDMRLMLAYVADQQLTDPEFVPSILRTWSVDGLLINYNAGFPKRLAELTERFRIPAIWINSKTERDCIHPDDLRAGEEGAQHLLNLGHKRVAFMDFNYGHRNSVPVHYSNIDRYDGYARIMRKAGLFPIEIRGEEGAIPREERFEFIRRCLKRPNRPTAVLAYTPETALPLYAAARELGLRIPRDLSILTFHTEICNELGFFLDTFVLPERAMAALAVERVLAKIDDRSLVFEPATLPLKLEAGWSTAPPRGARAKGRG